MPSRLSNPYGDDSLPWRKGNLHAHTTLSDGEATPQEVVNAYAALGYDFLMLADHDAMADPGTLDPKGLVLLPGNEISTSGPHLLHVNARGCLPPDPDRANVLAAIQSSGGFAVLSHPNYGEQCDHWPQSLLDALDGYLGIEICNGVVRYLKGNALATDRWDRLLGAGRRIWGFANDDCHRKDGYGLAWNMAQTASLDLAHILEALHAGRFYASTGVLIRSIQVAGNLLRVETENARKVAVVADYGQHAIEADGAAIEYEIPDDSPCIYLRVECWGEGESQAWTQPFFLE